MPASATRPGIWLATVWPAHLVSQELPAAKAFLLGLQQLLGGVGSLLYDRWQRHARRARGICRASWARACPASHPSAICTALLVQRGVLSPVLIAEGEVAALVALGVALEAVGAR